MRAARFGTDERNVARLNVALILTRVPAGLTRWHKQLKIDALGTIDVSCRAEHNQVVPHGIDADVILALTTAFELQGRPADRKVMLTTSELCDLVRLSLGSFTYTRVHASLLRLKSVLFNVTECWQLPGYEKTARRSNTFRIIENIVEEDNPFGEGRFLPRIRLHIVLSKEIAKSISGLYVRQVDLEFYGKLSQPPARLLYRLLEEQHTLWGGKTFSVPVLEWGNHLGCYELVGEQVTVTSPARIRRTLESPHAELLKQGYLSNVAYQGRGQGQVLHYTFGDSALRPVDLQLVGALTQRGVALDRAEDFARRLPERIPAAVHVFDKHVAGVDQPRAALGLLTDLLDYPEKYVLNVDTPAPSSHKKPKAAVVVKEPEIGSVPDLRTFNMKLSKALNQKADRELRDQLCEAYLGGLVSSRSLALLNRL